MGVWFPQNPKELRIYNLKKYNGITPSWDLIEQVVKKSGLKRLAIFEYVWEIPSDTLTLYKNGERGLPARYWHIFYDFDLINQKYSKLHTKRKKRDFSPTNLPTGKITNGIK